MKLNAYIIKDYVSFSIITSFLNSSPLDCNLERVTVYRQDKTRQSSDLTLIKDEIEEYLRERWDIFLLEKQQQWTSLALYINNKGDFNIDYDYSDLSNADPYKQHVIWKYEKLGLCPQEDRNRDIKMIGGK